MRGEVKPDNSDYVTNHKTRLAYGTGADECSPKCKCLMCKRKREEENGNNNIQGGHSGDIKKR
jgi:hypothetical protein